MSNKANPASNGMEILHWPISPELKKEAEENYRTNYALSLKNREPLEIIRELTFDGVVPNITVRDIERIFDFVECNFLAKKIAGVGLEVGSGPGTFSSILAKRKRVNKVYGAEACRPIVEILMPKVAEYILNGNLNKVIGAIGSFDDIQLPGESVDFIFDFFSLHHSNNLIITLKECARVLKKDGFIFCFDKARPDYYTQEDLDELLDAEYGADYKRQFGLPLDQKLTRRMNGEKEYRLRDWRASFDGAGFSRVDYYYLEKTYSANKTSGFIKNLLSLIPPWLQKKLNKFLPELTQNHKFILSSKNRVYSRFVNPFRKEMSLLIAYK